MIIIILMQLNKNYNSQAIQKSTNFSLPIILTEKKKSSSHARN